MLIAPFKRRDTRGNVVARQAKTQHEIPIARLGFAWVQLQRHRLGAVPLRANFVLRRVQGLHPQGAGQGHADAGRNGSRIATLGPISGIGIAGPHAVRRCSGRGMECVIVHRLRQLAPIARADHGGIHPLIHPVVGHEQFAVLQGQL